MSNPALGSPDQPTVALVHGAFADSSGWEGVIEHLQLAQVQVMALPNPLRGLTADSAYIASALQQISGPVLAVGHSYGGAVITNAARDAKNVIGLVYVAAFAPDEGETLTEIEGGSRDSVLSSALSSMEYPTGRASETAVEFAINAGSFHDAFAADLPPSRTAVMAVTQRPAAAQAFSEPSGEPAWKRLPTWAIVPTGDKAAGSDVLRAMARRARANTIQVEGSHAIMISRPQVVADLIMQALEGLRRTESPRAQQREAPPPTTAV